MGTRRRIGELLIDAGTIRAEDLERALAHQRSIHATDRPRLGQVLIELGMLTEARLLRALSQQLAVPIVSLRRVDFSAELLARLPRALAEKHCMIPVYVRRERNDATTLFVAMEDPNDPRALALAAQSSGLPVKPMIASLSDIREAIRTVYVGEDPAWVDRTEVTPRPSRRPPSVKSTPPAATSWDDQAVTQPSMRAVVAPARVARRASRPVTRPPQKDTVPELAVPWLDEPTVARRTTARSEPVRRKSARANAASTVDPPASRAATAQLAARGRRADSVQPAAPAVPPAPRRSARAFSAEAPPAEPPPPRSKR